MKKYRNKETINTLLHIDNVFGEFSGKALPIVIVLCTAVAPIILWAVFLLGSPIKIWMVLVVDVIITFRVMCKVMFKEDEKIEFYLKQRADEYKSADEIVHISHIHEDGLIEFDTGRVSYLVSGYVKSYLNDDKLSLDIETFMNELDRWSWDFFLHNTVDELLCEDELPLLKRYTDDTIIRERIDFYVHQDEWARTNSNLYRITFLVTAGKYDWKKLKAHLTELISSDVSRAFSEIDIMNYDMVSSILNRDICGYVSIREMLMKKYDNNEYYDSRVVWYDDNVPTELLKDKETSSMEGRRI